MKFTNRKEGITLTQNQWASLSLALFLALVVAVLVLPPWSPVSLTSPGAAGPNPEARPPEPQPAGARVDPVPSPGPAGENPGVAPAPAAASTPQAAPAATATATPKPLPTTLPARTPLPSPTATPPPAETPVPEPAATAAPSASAGPEAPPSVADASVEELILATNHPVWGTRWDAVNKLGELEDIRAVPALVRRALYDENPHPQWRALWALTAVDREGVETIPLFLSALKDPDPVVVHNAALGLAFFGRSEARPALLEGLKSPNTFRRWESVFSLRSVGDAQVVEALLPFLDPQVEPDDGIRGEVILVLGRIALEETTPVLLDALRNDISPKVRWRATLSLGSSSDSSLLAELEQALSAERDPLVREGIKEAIAKLR